MSDPSPEKQAITAEFREVLGKIGKGWAKPIKMHERVPGLSRKHGLILKYLPDYQFGGSSVIDFSCGTGALIEIMRHFGNKVMGVEHYYLDYLRSQNLPHVEHDCNRFPYPFADKSYNLVTCIGSITFYDAEWSKVLDEFFRIARKEVFLIVNSGPVRDQQREILDNYRPELRVNINDDAVYHWRLK